jgi:hypothetical protein
MADHGGQIPDGTFEVTNLQVATEPGIMPFNILDPTLTCTISATFQGQGSMTWLNMKSHKEEFEARFFAEAIGIPPSDINLGVVKGHLVEGQDTYTLKLQVPPNTFQVGLYEVGVVVTFPLWIGTLGYYEGLIVQAATTAA